MYKFRRLRSEKLIETTDGLRRRIADVFPSAGLLQVAGELSQVVGEALATTERIGRPNIPLRIGIGALILGLAGVLGAIIFDMRAPATFLKSPLDWAQFTDSSLTSVVFLGGGIVFLVTLETRLKRRRALHALHELRAMAHIVDMHQLRKAPGREYGGTGPDPGEAAAGEQPSGVRAAEPSPAPSDAGGAAAPAADAGEPRKTLGAAEMTRYLGFCSEMLSIISKIAAVYVQDFPDSAALQAADQVETLTNGLSRKIWQKIALLNHLSATRAELPG